MAQLADQALAEQGPAAAVQPDQAEVGDGDVDDEQELAVDGGLDGRVVRVADAAT